MQIPAMHKPGEPKYNPESGFARSQEGPFMDFQRPGLVTFSPHPAFAGWVCGAC